MKSIPLRIVVLAVAGTLIAGCAGKEDQPGADPSAEAPEYHPPPEETQAMNELPDGEATVPPPVPGGVIATSPEVQNDPVGVFRITGEEDEQGNLIKLSDLEALQRVVDAYSFGTDGLGAPPLSGLSDLVTKGLVRGIPDPPPGKRWNYDPKTWKVSLVDQ